MDLKTRIKQLEKIVPKWVIENKQPTDTQAAMVTDEQILAIQEYQVLLNDPEDFKDPNRRDAECIGILGSKGKGKSRFVSRHFKKMESGFELLGVNRPILIYLPNADPNYLGLPTITAAELVASSMVGDNHPLKWKTGIRIMYGSLPTHEKNITVITTYFLNGVIVFEEANEWMQRQGVPPNWQLKVFSQNRHRGVDIWCCMHGFMNVPLSFRKYFNGFWIMKGEEKIPSAKWFTENNFSGEPDELYKIWHYVNIGLLNDFKRQQAGRFYYINRLKPVKIK